MTYPIHPAPTDFPVTDLMQKRWSPVIFNDTALTGTELQSLFEAARWSPSCFNEQPWRFVYAQKNDEGRTAIEGLLVEGNAWAKNAGLLIVGFGKKTFTRNDKPNHYALYDTGAAALSIVLQATAMGLISHQMAGFASEKANEVLGVPEDFVVASMIAIGHAGDQTQATEDMQKRDKSPRERKSQGEFVFHGQYKS